MSAQAELYRKPFKPGYLGSYNWPAMALGCTLFLLTNWASTEYIAMRFEYQPALGDPLFQVGHKPVYPPFAWFLWGLHNITSHDPAVRRPLGEGIVILFFGCAVSIFLYFGANSLRSRRLSANAEHLHCSARWATGEDIRETGLLDASEGVYVGGWKPKRWSHLHYLRHDGPEHVLVFAPTRSGKGVSLVIPTLLAWNDSAVIYDIKGENWAKTAGFRSQQGHICFRFCPVEQSYGSRFNPLAEVRLFTDRDVSDAQNIAEILGRTHGQHTPSDPHWQDTGVSIICGMILHVCYEAKTKSRTATLADLTNAFSRSTDFRDTLTEMAEFCHDPAGEAGWPAGTHPVIRQKAIECLTKEERAGWRAVHDYHGAAGVLRSADRAKYVGERLFNSGSRQPRTAHLALSGGAEQRSRPAHAAHAADLYDHHSPADGDDGVQQGCPERESSQAFVPD